MSAVFVVVGDQFAAEAADVRLVERDHVVEAIAAGCLDPTFRDSVLPRARDGGLDDFHCGIFQCFQYIGIELGVVVKDRVRNLAGGIGKRLSELLAGRLTSFQTFCSAFLSTFTTFQVMTSR